MGGDAGSHDTTSHNHNVDLMRQLVVLRGGEMGMRRLKPARLGGWSDRLSAQGQAWIGKTGV